MIGDWENQVGYRGYIEVWKNQVSNQEIVIEPFDDIIDEDMEDHLRNCLGYSPDKSGEWDLWLVDTFDHKTGFAGSLGIFDGFEEADKRAKQFMKDNPNGF